MRGRALLLVLALGCTKARAPAADEAPEPAPPPSPRVPYVLPAEDLAGAPAPLLLLARKLEPLTQGKGKPRRYDWLASHPEAGQTFAQYQASDPNRLTAAHTTLYVVALADPDPALLPFIAKAEEALGLFYGLPVKHLPPIALAEVPADQRRPAPGDEQTTQLQSGFILDLLKARRPADAVAVIAFTGYDLWPGERWNFVLGQADLDERVGVWSLARLGDPLLSPVPLLRRTVQVAIHETGHIMGMPHCAARECGMNGSNALGESDRNPIAFCPVDELKLWWGFHLEPHERLQQLATWARRAALVPEADAWQAQADALAK